MHGKPCKGYQIPGPEVKLVYTALERRRSAATRLFQRQPLGDNIPLFRRTSNRDRRLRRNPGERPGPKFSEGGPGGPSLSVKPSISQSAFCPLLGVGTRAIAKWRPLLGELSGPSGDEDAAGESSSPVGVSSAGPLLGEAMLRACRLPVL